MRTPLVIRGEERLRASAADLGRVPIVLPERRHRRTGAGRRHPASRTDRSRSSARTASASQPSWPTCAGAISSASSTTPRRPSAQVADCPRAIRLSGAASSKTSSAPRRASRSSCRSRSALIFLLLYLTFGSLRQAIAGVLQRPVRHHRRHHRALGFRGISVGARLGRLHRADRHRGAQRRRADLLHQRSCARAAHCRSARR